MREMTSLLLQAMSGVALVFYCFVALLYQPLVSWILFPLALGGTMIMISKYADRAFGPRYAPILIVPAPLLIAIAMMIRLGGNFCLPAAFAIVGVILLSIYFLGVVLGAETSSVQES